MNRNLSDIELFDRLKKCVQNTFLEQNTTAVNDISQWKGQDIVNFQEDLHLKTKARVSEKWFYTYMKSDKTNKLPRIDMLNLLCNYCGYVSWQDFINQQNTPTEPKDGAIIGDAPKENLAMDSTPKSSLKLTKVISVGSVSVLVLGLLYLFVFEQDWIESLQKGEKYEFKFVDAEKNNKIKDLVEVTLNSKGFLPVHMSSKSGNITFYSKQDTLQMVVESYFYETDTFKINLQNYFQPVEIELTPDNYKLVWQYYLRSDVKTRKAKLMASIRSDAQIYRVYENQENFIEPFSREEYINFLLLPTTSLDQFRIINSRKKGNKFSYIKFKIENNEE